MGGAEAFQATSCFLPTVTVSPPQVAAVHTCHSACPSEYKLIGLAVTHIFRPRQPEGFEEGNGIYWAIPLGQAQW